MRLRVSCLALLAALCAPVARSGEPPTPKEQTTAVRRAVGYLDAHLLRLPETQGTPRKPFTFAVAGLVYLMEGRTRAGPSPIPRIQAYLEGYVEQVDRKLKDPENLPAAHGVADSRTLCQYTWPLAAAGLFLGELDVRGIGGRSGRRTLERILVLLADAQQENGGWGHGKINPSKKKKAGDAFGGLELPQLGGGYPSTLVSSSNCVAITVGLLGTLKGLDAGSQIEKAQAYYRAARLDNGSFPYDPSQRQSGFAKINAGRSAGALFAMHCLGMPRDSGWERSVAYVEREFEFLPEGHGSPCLNLMQAALACRMLGREKWQQFRESFFARIVATQDDEGALGCICEGKAFGVTCDSKGMFEGLGGVFRTEQDVYTTALQAFILLLDRQELEIVGRRPPGAPITRSR